MAEHILVNFAEGILHKLGSHALQQLRLASGVTKELKRLESSMSTVRNILLDAEEQQVTNRAVREWMQMLKDILFDVDEMLDDFATEALQRQVEVHGNKLKEVRNFFTSSNPFKVRYSNGRKIKDLRERLEEVLADMKRFEFVVNLVDKQINFRRRDETYSYVPSSGVIGREVDKEAIIQLLTLSKDEKNIDIIPIVGMGGLGKTTLAQFVYDDKWVKEHFMRRLWVCVSIEFDMKDILAKILEVDGDSSSCKNLGIEELQNRLRQRLSDMKFFLVLDDVWNEDRVRWINLRDLLMVGRGGSRIVVTTRSRTVASIMGTVPAYKLKGLSDNDCLSVLLNWAFKEGDCEKYPNLVHIGRDIVRKCGGVPLAARTLGSLMYATIDERKWLLVRDSEVWELVHKDNDILPVLRLSYDQMPSYLKQCFAYCSLLLKDQEINKQKLIYCWMAQGFIKSSNPNQELEETGESYFNELMRISFLEKSQRSSYYKMHDLVHDLAQSVAGSECHSLRSEVDMVIPDGVRHVSFHNKFILRLPKGTNALHDGNKLRTIFTYATLPCSFTAISPTFRYLRVLDLKFCETSIPSSIFKYLKHLRYLSMRWDHGILPDSFSKLFNLQYLDLRSDPLVKLPKGFKNLINLRHLALECRSFFVPLLDEWIGKLTSLRSLTIWNGRKLTSLPEGFQRLTNLRILKIYIWGELVSLSPGMRYLVALEELYIENCENLQFRDDDFQELSNLKSLTLIRLPWLESLPIGLQCAALTLTCFRVHACERLTTLSVSLENFASLESLTIRRCPNLMHLPERIQSLTKLQSLEIDNCPMLLSLPEGIQSLTKLQSLTIRDCPELSRRYSENGGEPWHHISHIPNIIISRY